MAWRYAGTKVAFRRQKVTPATTRNLQIPNLILNSPYEVKVQMYNDAGAGPYSDPLQVKTKEGGKCKYYDTSCIFKHTNSFLCNNIVVVIVSSIKSSAKSCCQECFLSFCCSHVGGTSSDKLER